MCVTEVFAKMVKETALRALPEPGFYRDLDLQTDSSLLELYEARDVTRFVWGINPGCTHLFPLGAGVASVDARPSLLRCRWIYLVDITNGTVRMVTLAQALAELDVPINISPILTQAQAQIARLLAMPHWGLFEPPSIPSDPEHWSDWKRYFSARNNRVMTYAISDAMMARL